jgi:hypothetical protein
MDGYAKDNEHPPLQKPYRTLLGFWGDLKTSNSAGIFGERHKRPPSADGT